MAILLNAFSKAVSSLGSDATNWAGSSRAVPGSADPRTPARVATVFLADFKLAASQWAILVVSAPAGDVVEPDARGAVERAATGSTRPVIGEELIQQVRALPFEPLPRVLSDRFEHVIERWARDDLAARTAIVAGLDNGKTREVYAHHGSL
jgi:hypothetical protein